MALIGRWRDHASASWKALLLPCRRWPVRRRDLAGRIQKWPVPASCLSTTRQKYAAGTGHFWSPPDRLRHRIGRRQRGRSRAFREAADRPGLTRCNQTQRSSTPWCRRNLIGSYFLSLLCFELARLRAAIESALLFLLSNISEPRQ